MVLQAVLTGAHRRVSFGGAHGAVVDAPAAEAATEESRGNYLRGSRGMGVARNNLLDCVLDAVL